jgi:ribonuclease J
MVELTFFGGVKEIGGNKILLEDNGTRVFLDFGLSFGLRKKYYDEFLQARSFAIVFR